MCQVEFKRSPHQCCLCSQFLRKHWLQQPLFSRQLWFQVSLLLLLLINWLYLGLIVILLWHQANSTLIFFLFSLSEHW